MLATLYETCTEQLSPFGGLLALIKFFDLVNFHKILHSAYRSTFREPKLGTLFDDGGYFDATVYRV